MEWIAYCKNCKEELIENKNRGVVETIAMRHARKKDHTVIVGYEVKKDDKN